MNDEPQLDIANHLELIAAGKHPIVARIESNAAETRIFFRDGKVLRHLTGRNEKCPCGSGKKFKRCKCYGTVKPTSPFKLSMTANPSGK